MQFISETTSDSISERLFDNGGVPGVLWSPVGATEPGALVLVGHGGGQHKMVPRLVARARHYVTCGFAVAAIDAPSHGDRPRTERDERFSAEVRERMASGRPVGSLVAQHNAELAAQAVPEWQSTLDALQEVDCIGTGGPVGYSGMSLGTGIGINLVAAEPRITAAVLGLLGVEAVAEPAARITVPVEFLLQWDDQLVPRDSALALFDTLASAEKTLHANPGGHGDIPGFELDSSARFFSRHLIDGRQR